MKKKIFAGLLIAAGILGAGSLAGAQVVQTSFSGAASAASSFPCVAFNKDLSYGTSGSFVSQLQQYLGISPTGYFGSITRGKLQIFQSTHGIPATGYFGPLSRAFLIRLICNGSTTQPPAGQAPTISFISPSVASVGAQVTITGTNFDSKSYVLFDGGASGPSSSPDGTHLTFTVPSYVGAVCNLFTSGSACPMYARQISAGNHSITVVTANGTSNNVSFSVVDTSTTCGALSPCTNQPPTISGGTFPTTLVANQAGTWIVNASDPENGALRYSADWGDSANCSNYACPSAASSVQLQQTSTFTHSYANPGTYTARFTVTDAAGLSAQTSATVVVTSSPYTQAPSISYLSPVSGSAGTVVTIRGSGFTATGNTVRFSDATAWAAATYSTDIPSYDGVTLTFIVPVSKGACPPGAYCIASLVYWPPYEPGTYPIYVTNANGSSNSVNFTLTGTTQTNDSGINGTVTTGPTCPVQYYPPQPGCADRPYQTALIITSQSGAAAASQTVSSDANGKFSIAFAPGTYTISQQGSSYYPRLSPQTVSVYAHSYTNVNLMFDSGIR